MSRNASVKSLHKNKSGEYKTGGITFPMEEAAHVGYRSPEKSGIRGSSRNSGTTFDHTADSVGTDLDRTASRTGTGKIKSAGSTAYSAFDASGSYDNDFED